MFHKWLKKQIPTKDELVQQPHLSWLGSIIHNPNLFHINRRSVSCGVAAGLFAAFVPLPMQMLIAATIAVLLNGNLPIAVALTWITNPITFVPIQYLTFKIGQLVLNDKTEYVAVNVLELQDKSWQGLKEWFVESMHSFGKPFLVGAPILAISAALLGYFLVLICWRLAVKSRWNKRRQQKSMR